MTLPVPDIDDRKFEDLLEEAVSLLPRYNSEWTNFNPSDPGIALLELFAWLTETAIYRANLVPDDSTWKFLELVGIRRKRKTRFSEELVPGDIIVADGQIRIVEKIDSDSSLAIDMAFEPDLYRSSSFASLRSEIYYGDMVLGETEDVDSEVDFEKNGVGKKKGKGKGKKSGHTGEGEEGGGEEKKEDGYENDASLSPPTDGDIIISCSEGGVYSFSPYKTDSNLEEEAYLKTEQCAGTVRARGKHLMGDGTVFSELEEGDVIVAGSRLRVVSDIKSDLLLTVHVPFDVDIDDAVNCYFIRPELQRGTILSDGFRVTGNREDEELESAVFRAVEYVSDNYRAVTTEDYEVLASKALGEMFEDKDFRVICMNNRNFEWQGMGSERPGHVSLFIIARCNGRYLAGEGNTGENEIVEVKVLEKVESFLDPRRLLTTRVHAVYPRFKKFAIEAALQIMKGVDEEILQKEAVKKLKLFFDPLEGGPDGSGWPLGRNLYRSEVYQALEGLRGVDHVLSLSIIKDYGKNIVKLDEDELIELECAIDLKRG